MNLKEISVVILSELKGDDKKGPRFLDCYGNKCNSLSKVSFKKVKTKGFKDYIEFLYTFLPPVLYEIWQKGLNFSFSQFFTLVSYYKINA